VCNFKLVYTYQRDYFSQKFRLQITNYEVCIHMLPVGTTIYAKVLKKQSAEITENMHRHRHNLFQQHGIDAA